MRRFLLATLAATVLVAAMAIMSCDSGSTAAPDCADGASQACTTACATSGVQVCADGAWGDCLSAAQEQCNGVDDDCDQEIDEGLAAQPCNCGSAVGTQACINGAFTPCTAGDPSTEELCNNQDDNCNGQVDEGLTKPCTTDCGDGNETCYYGEWGACDAPAGGDEICDGKDNNCNDEIDDGLGEVTCGLGECEHTAPACEGGVAGVCDPMEGSVEEICDTKDNDCDGEIDEGVAGCCTEGEMGECSSNEGECEKGTATCDADGSWGDCTGVLPVDEVCDGKDNDCDGEIDEGNPGGGAVCGSEVGECEQGIETCVDAAIICQGEKTATSEVCDAKDNDCNEEIDDGLTPDEFEANEACTNGYEFPDDLEELSEGPLNFAGNLYKVDGSDEDWYKIHFKEATDVIPPCSWNPLKLEDMCYALAIVMMEAPGVDQELCIKMGECGEPDFEACAGAGDEIDVGWAGTWLFSDDQDIYVQVKGDQTCAEYAVQVTPYAVCPNEGLCPWEDGYVAPE